MQRTLLEIIAAASAEMAQSVPQDVISATDNYSIQMRALFAQICDEHVAKHTWQALMRTRSFTTVPGQAAYDLSDDHYRIVNDTLFDRANQRFVLGSTSPKRWTQLTGNAVSTNNQTRYRIQANKIVLTPTPSEATEITYDYISSFYVIDSGSHLPKFRFDSNSDTVVFDNRLMINALKLKFLASKGFNTQAAQIDYDASFESAISADSGGGTLSLVPDCDPWSMNIPDTGYGQ